jgi:hypothetical protein
MPRPKSVPTNHNEEDLFQYDEQALFEYGDIIQEYKELTREERFSLEE